MKLLYFLILFLSLTYGSLSRQFSSSYPEQVSDGFNVENSDSSNLLQFKGITENFNGEEMNEAVCEQMYGFLPCSKSAMGHLFLILVYEYLLFHGESYVASGGEQIFKILGPSVFGASAFQLIGSLPEALILLASGLMSNEETAQECVLTGVGLLAGSTIFHLTLLWGSCVLIGALKCPNSSYSIPSNNRNRNPLEKLLSSLWPGYGVVTDLGTSYTARIMLLSVIPLFLIQFSRIFRSSYVGERVFVMITLVVSILFLLSYFFYQFFQPWIQKRQLLYIKHEHLVVDVLKHVQKATMGNLLTGNGSPNITRLKSFVEKQDIDGDKIISFSELKEFLQEVNFRQQSDKENTTIEIMKEFDIDSDQKITVDEFVSGMTKWLDDTKDALNKRYHSVKSLKDMYKVLQPWIQKKREEREVMRHMIPDVVLHLQNSMYGSLLASDGTTNIPAIKRLFKKIDLDKDGSISYSELKEVMTNIKFGIIPYDADVAATKIMEELDVSGNKAIDENEFVSGLSKWINTTYNQHSKSEESEEEDEYQKNWEQTDKLVKNKSADKAPLAWAKSVSLLVLGVFILGVLAEPLIHSVREFSKAANVSSFYIAFIFVPLATNARLAVSALSEARRKKLHTTSLALSEIYGTVFINNILGLAVLLSLIYFRDLTWNFSTEVLMVLAVSTIIGCIASLSTVFVVWTSVLAYMLYPLSLILVYFFGDFGWLAQNLELK